MFLPKLEALLSVRLCITLAPKKLHLRRKSWARFFTDRPLCLPGWPGTKTEKKNTAWLHNRTFTGQTGAHAVPGEQLSPWWLYAPRQSPATRWRTPLWRSFSAAPSAPERRWWSHLEKIKKKTTGRDELLHYQYKGFPFELEQQKRLFVTATCSEAVLHSE